MKQLGELRDLLSESGRQEVELLAVSSDPPDKLRTMVERIRAKSPGAVTYRLLSDADHRVIDRYGLRNEAAAKGRFIPHPTTYVLDKQGKVEWRFTEVNFRVRPSNEAIRQALQK